jgi:hypothetical protein
MQETKFLQETWFLTCAEYSYSVVRDFSLEKTVITHFEAMLKKTFEGKVFLQKTLTSKA